MNEDVLVDNIVNMMVEKVCSMTKVSQYGELSIFSVANPCKFLSGTVDSRRAGYLFGSLNQNEEVILDEPTAIFA